MEIMYYLNKQNGSIETLENASIEKEDDLQIVFYSESNPTSKLKWKALKDCYPSYNKAVEAYEGFVNSEIEKLKTKLKNLQKEMV